VKGKRKGDPGAWERQSVEGGAKGKVLLVLQVEEQSGASQHGGERCLRKEEQNKPTHPKGE